MNSFGEFQDIETNKSSRLSHVSSQSEMIPSCRALLCRDKRLLLETWNESGVQENVFGNQFSTFDSPRDFPQRIQYILKTCREIEKQYLNLTNQRGKASLTSGDGQNCGTIPMPTFASRPLTASSTIPVELLQNYMVGQQRQQMSELQFDKFQLHNRF